MANFGQLPLCLISKPCVANYVANLSNSMAICVKGPIKLCASLCVLVSNVQSHHMANYVYYIMWPILSNFIPSIYVANLVQPPSVSNVQTLCVANYLSYTIYLILTNSLCA